MMILWHGKRERGVSIIEAILATFLVGIFLVVLSDLTSSLSRVTVVSEKKGSAVDVRRTIFNSLRADLWEAVQIKEPQTAAKASKVTLSRLKPDGLAPSATKGSRLLMPPESRVSYRWDPIAVDHLEVVAYDLDGTSMRRKAGADPIQTVAVVNRFQASQPKAGLFEIVVEIETNTNPQILKCVVDRR